MRDQTWNFAQLFPPEEADKSFNLKVKWIPISGGGLAREGLKWKFWRIFKF